MFKENVKNVIFNKKKFSFIKVKLLMKELTALTQISVTEQSNPQELKIYLILLQKVQQLLKT